MTNRQKTFLLPFILFPLLVLLSNLKGIYYNCFHAIDFGIYQQALYELAHSGSLNPYMTIRDLNVFNDHFQPILFLTIPYIWLTGSSPFALIFWEWAWFVVALIAVIFFKRKDQSSLEETLYLLGFVVFSKGFLSGMEFPIHPGTWVGASFLAVAYFLYKKNFKGVYLALLSTCLFRESFPFAFMGISLFYLMNKEWRHFLIMLGTGVGLYILFYKVRPVFTGLLFDYSKIFTVPLSTDPIGFIIERARVFNYKTLFKISYPLLIPIYFIFKSEVKTQKEFFSHPFVGIIFMMAPLWGLHFLADKFGYHYGTGLMIPFVGGIVFSSFYKSQQGNKGLLTLCLLLFIVSSSSIYTKMVKQLVSSQTKSCVMTADKCEKTKSLLEKVESIKSSELIMTTGRVAPRLIKPGRQVFQIGMFSRVPESFDYLLIERHPGDNKWPLSEGQIDKIQQNCQGHIQEILQQDEFYFFAKGSFQGHCINRSVN